MKGKQKILVKEAIIELLKLSLQRGCKVEFCAPEDPLEERGSFFPHNIKIEIYKERTDPLTAWHVYAFAHEYKHLNQYLSLDGVDSWLYCIDCVAKNNHKEDARLEMDADTYAVQFVKDRGIKIPQELLTWVKDRKEYYSNIDLNV